LVRSTLIQLSVSQSVEVVLLNDLVRW